ncbi:MAG: hypothetical protein RLZZ344_1368 [Pseudomonadota bacterium]
MEFLQPKSPSVALIRVVGSDVSRIQGALTANLLITPRPVTVELLPQSKRAGDRDPIFSYRVVSGRAIAGDVFLVTRPAGEGVGEYPLTASNPNYLLTQNSQSLTILPTAVSPSSVAGSSATASSPSVARASQNAVNPQINVTAVPSLPESVNLAGGLAFVEVTQPTRGEGIAMNAVGTRSTDTSASQSEFASQGESPMRIELPKTKINGYSTVFVVNGGINIPFQTDLISD